MAMAFPVTGLYYLYCAYYSETGHVLLGNIITAVYMLISPLAVALPLGNIFGFSSLATGFMLAPVLAVCAAVIIILIKYGRKAVPLILDGGPSESLSYDLYLESGNITALCEKVRDDLVERNISFGILNDIQLVIEESCMTIMDENPGRKVMSECDILLNGSSLTLIIRDNGRIFDITDANAEIKSFRSYVLARLMENSPTRRHVTTVSYNRNSFAWKLQK